EPGLLGPGLERGVPDQLLIVPCKPGPPGGMKEVRSESSHRPSTSPEGPARGLRGSLRCAKASSPFAHVFITVLQPRSVDRKRSPRFVEHSFEWERAGTPLAER